MLSTARPGLRQVVRAVACANSTRPSVSVGELARAHAAQGVAADDQSSTSGARSVKRRQGRKSKNARLSHGLVITTVTPSSATRPDSFAAYAARVDLRAGHEHEPDVGGAATRGRARCPPESSAMTIRSSAAPRRAARARPRRRRPGSTRPDDRRRAATTMRAATEDPRDTQAAIRAGGGASVCRGGDVGVCGACGPSPRQGHAELRLAGRHDGLDLRRRADAPARGRHRRR